jgi:hypothetical protein
MLPIEKRLLDDLLAARTVYTRQTSVFHVLPTVLGSFGLHDVQTSMQPLWFLTDADGSDSGLWDPRVWAYYKQGYQHGSGQPGSRHPLTERESSFLWSGVLPLKEYPSDLFTGYAAWWRDRKWASPALVYPYAVTPIAEGLSSGPAEQRADRQVMRAFVESEAQRLYRELQGHDGATVLLDLDRFQGRFLLHLLVPMATLSSSYSDAHAWREFLLALFKPEEGVLAPGTPVYIDDVCFDHDQHTSGCSCGTCNANGKVFACQCYDLTVAPLMVDEERVRAWLNEQDACWIEWAASEHAALHNMRRACEWRGYDPVDPVTRERVPREYHALRS